MAPFHAPKSESERTHTSTHCGRSAFIPKMDRVLRLEVRGMVEFGERIEEAVEAEAREEGFGEVYGENEREEERKKKRIKK
jgi:hypothetical protein